MIISFNNSSTLRFRWRSCRRYFRVSPKGLIFCNHFGLPLGLDAIRKKFKRLLKEAGLPEIRLYDGRHTSATLLMASGINRKVVSERLGHSNVAITLGTYSHVTQQLQKEASDKLGEALFG